MLFSTPICLSSLPVVKVIGQCSFNAKPLYTLGSRPLLVTHFSIILTGDSKAKPKKFVSSAATVSLALKNSQGVSAGTGCLQPGAWRGCLKSSWCVTQLTFFTALCTPWLMLPVKEHAFSFDLTTLRSYCYKLYTKSM